MTQDDVNIHRRSSERLRYAVDVAHKSINDAYKIFSVGKKPYHQLFSDVCQDITAQLDTLNLLIKPLLKAAPRYDFEDYEANGFRSLLAVVDCALKELIVHLKYCIDKHNSFFFNGTNAAKKLGSLCILLAKLGKLLDVATLMDQQMCGNTCFLEINNPVGKICAQELDELHRECFYGELVGFQYLPSLQRVMKGICVALTSYGIGYYSDVPAVLGAPSYSKSFFWKSSASIVGGAKYWFKEDERAAKFVELTHQCASIQFTKSFWNLVETGIIAEVPKLVNKSIDVAIEIFINGEPIYVRNKHDKMILIHPPVGKQGFAGVTVGFLSAKLRDGQYTPPPSALPEVPAMPLRRTPKCNRLLVHFHGGGFVAGSHTYHETYLRAWCIELDTVVVSINYSLAPENPFPKGLDDCIFAYAWCLENLHSLGCTGRSILFMGDSAGGNLAICTAMRANSYGLRAPDAILTAYPVTYVKYSASASRLLGAMDVLLPVGILQCCLRAYAGVPVENNAMFYEWLQSAHTKHAESENETETKPQVESISEQNSKYISDISLPTSDPTASTSQSEQPKAKLGRLWDKPPPSSFDTPPDTPGHGTSPDPDTSQLAEGDPAQDPADTIELDTIKFSPIVFEQNDNIKLLTDDTAKGDDDQNQIESESTGNMESEITENSDNIESETDDKNVKITPEKSTEHENLDEIEINIETENQDKNEITEEKETENVNGDDNEIKSGNVSENEIEVEIEINSEDETIEEAKLSADINIPGALADPLFSDISITKTPQNGFHDLDDLEKMLYDDQETRFKAAKLVLTPSKTERERETPTPSPVKSVPNTPTRSNVYKEPNPLGMMATVITDAQTYENPEPAYVINPGEMATRKNVTLLQKYFDDPFLSPLLADDETLKNLPPIHVVAAEFDPLLDDSVAFCRKVKAAGGNIKLEVVYGMTHGFLNLVLQSTVCASAAKRCLEILDKQFREAEKV